VVPALAASDRHTVVSQVSRDADGSDSAYELVLRDPEVDIVYNPLPNGLHRIWVERALAAGKHVLCEKPLGMHEAEAAEMFDAADAAGRVVIEAYMTPFHPRSVLLARLVQEGRLGTVRFVHASFTFLLENRNDHRLDPRLGDGASLDVGIYCVAPMLATFGRLPESVTASAVRNAAGVDTTVAAFLDFGGGATGAFECSFDAPALQVLELMGTEASVRVEPAFVPGPDDDTLELRGLDGEVEVHRCGGANPYRAMVDHVWSVVRDGATPHHGRRETLAVAAVLDRVRGAARTP